MCLSKKNRRTPYWKIPVILHWDDPEYAIRYVLKNQGFHRYLARRKPPISEKNRQVRLQWAEEHLYWTKDQWYLIFWKDETWITDGRHTRTWVTRRRGEEFDSTCIVEREVKKKGCMFWGGFSGRLGKGPSLFWKKVWTDPYYK